MTLRNAATVTITVKSLAVADAYGQCGHTR